MVSPSEFLDDDEDDEDFILDVELAWLIELREMEVVRLEAATTAAMTLVFESSWFSLEPDFHEPGKTLCA